MISGLHQRPRVGEQSNLSIPVPCDNRNANGKAVEPICICVSKTLGTSSDISFSKVFGDLTQVVNMDLQLGEACHFIFRKTDVYFSATIDNVGDNELSHQASKASMSRIFQHMATTRRKHLSTQYLHLHRCKGSWPHLVTGCNDANLDNISTTTYRGQLPTTNVRTCTSKLSAHNFK